MKKVFAVGAILIAVLAWATVPSTTRTVSYACDGAQTEYAYGFKILTNSDLVVTTSTATLTLTTDYTVTGAGLAAGGHIDLTAGSKCPADSTLTITRTVPFTQGTSFRTQGSFNPAVHENAFDKLTMEAQQIDQRVADAETTHAADKTAQDARDDAQDLALAAGAVGGNDTLVTASGATHARAQKDRAADVINVKDFGAACDGATDDKAAIQAAVAHGARIVRFPANATCRLASALALANDVRLVGQGSVLLFDFVGTGVNGTGIALDAEGITFDGNSKVQNLVILTSSSFRFLGVTMRNVYNAVDGAKAFACVTCTTGEIRASTFTNVHALGDTVEGNSIGSSRAIYLTGTPTNVVIADSYFSDIHTVDGAGTPVMEDGDAIQVASTGNDANVLVEGCTFSNVGKRAVKFQANRCTARDNWVISTWADPAKVMFAGFQLSGDHLTVTGNRIVGTYFQHGIELPIAGNGNEVSDNLIVQEGAWSLTGPYGQRSGITAESQTALRLTRNRVQDFANGIMIRGGSNIVVAENVLTGNARGTTVENAAATDLAVTGNTIVGRSNGAVEADIGSYFLTGTEGITVSGNTYRTLYDGVYFGGLPASAQVTGNTFADVGRSSVVEQVGAVTAKSGNARDTATATLAIGDRVRDSVELVTGAASMKFTLGAAAPGAGTHVANEVVINSAPAANAPFGWVCTAGGAPGTWVALAPVGRQIRATTSTNRPAIAANTCDADVAVTVTGAAVGAECAVGLPETITSGIQGTCYVSAADTVQLRLCNNSGAASDPPLATYSVRVWNP